MNKRVPSVLHLIGALDVGGAERNLVGLLAPLASMGFDVKVATVSWKGKLASELESKGVEVKNIGFKTRYFAVGFMKIVSLLKEMRADILHTHLYQAGIIGRTAGVMARVPVIVTTEHALTLWKGRRHILAERLLSRFTDRYHATCHAVLERRVLREHLPQEKFVIIPNGVDTSRFHPEGAPQNLRDTLGVQDVKTFGTVARLVPAKGLEFFLGASQEVIKRFPNSKALIIGDGPMRDKLTQHASELGLDGKVLFLGERDDIPALLRSMDVFVLSSLREGLPLSLLEASACGRPIVATGVGGNTDVVIDGVTGFLVPREDPQILAEKILLLLKNESLSGMMGKEGRKRAEEEFSFDVVAKKTADSYLELLKRKQRPF